MAYSQTAITWAKRQKAAACACGCEVIIPPKPAWYSRRHRPAEIRYIRGHSPQAEQAQPDHELPERPDGVILASKDPDAVAVQCSRPGCGTRWQVCESMADYITRECSFCAIDDIVADRVRQGIPVWPADDLDETEGAIEMNVPTYHFLKERVPHMSLGELARHIRNGTLHTLRDQRIASEVRDILDQCGLSEEYI